MSRATPGATPVLHHCCAPLPPGLYPAASGDGKLHPGKISHPLAFVWLSPHRGGRELLSSHVSHKLLPTDEFLSRKTRFRPGPAGGAYSTPSDPLAGLRGILQRGWGGEPSGSFSRFLALYKFVCMFLTLTRPSPLKKIPGKSPVSSARAVYHSWWLECVVTGSRVNVEMIGGRLLFAGCIRERERETWCHVEALMRLISVGRQFARSTHGRPPAAAAPLPM